MRERVLREHAICVLKHNGVDVSEMIEKGRVKHIMSKGEVAEAHFLPDYVPRHLLGRFAVKFGFSMGDFWEDDLIAQMQAPQPRVQ